jgi:integrase
MAVTKRGKFYHYQFMVDGQPHRGSTKETVKARAEQVEAVFKAEAKGFKGAVVGMSEAPVLRLFADRFLQYVKDRVEAGTLDKDTGKYYQYGWKQLEVTDLAKMRMDQISTSDAAIIQFAVSASYANQAFRTLRRMLSLAVDWGVLRTAPKIKTLEEHGRTALIEPAVEQMLVDHADQPLADILVTMMDCGMRPEEAMRIRKEHIYWNRSVVLVPYGKSFKSKRYVPLSDRMRTLLRDRDKGKSPWIFPSKRADSGHLTTVAKQWHKAVAAVDRELVKEGKPKISSDLVIYCARHTFATDMLNEGVNVAAVRELMGHSSLATTMKYLHPDTSGVASVVNRRNTKSKGLQLVNKKEVAS